MSATDHGQDSTAISIPLPQRDCDAAAITALRAERDTEKARADEWIVRAGNALAEVEKLTRERDGVMSLRIATAHNLAAAECSRLREALRRVEWCIVRSQTDLQQHDPMCPVCAHAMYAGHAKSCVIRAALSEGGEGKKP
jgi:hypothetical protein